MNANKKILLVHIGLIKTATTSLQLLWAHDKNIALVHNGLLKIVEKARLTVRNQKSGNSIPLQWQFDTQPKSTQHIVFSQEGLSSAYMNERASKNDIIRFQKFAAKFISKIVQDTKILITVREPKGWIKSTYNQAIKQGGIDTFPQFLKREQNFIEQSLDIYTLFKIWSGFFGEKNILVLPVELMRDDKIKFYKLIYKLSGVPTPDLNIAINANPSMKADHLKFMKRFNEWVEIFTQYGIYYPKIPQQLIEALNIIRFAVRYNLEAPPDDLASRLESVEKELPDCKIDLSHIDNQFLSTIQSSYNKLLNNNDFYGYRHLYLK